MPIPHYGVWVATPTALTIERDDFSAAINVKSIGLDSRLIYWLVNNLQNDFINSLRGLERGFHPLGAGNGLDYDRSHLVDFAEGTLLEYHALWPDNGIIDQVAPILQRAIESDNVTVYIFGSQFPHGDGIHDIHMNQGSLGQFDHGVGQDGGIVFHYHDNDRWEAIFLAFASQKIPTDENGLPRDDARELVTLLSPQTARAFDSFHIHSSSLSERKADVSVSDSK
ncbi:hypothetical protein EC957_007954 [Mortierella hygrophila]|uniref:DUF2278 family protein n=1 Tax=Mortierella hygrophila TaxID=979708 RepID=A0A9P6JYA9_9FUNG|nr:hypothetical protein EC957_007954 [Mortierella hygrophila]